MLSYGHMNSIEVQRAGNESNASLLRRFTKRVQGSGILRAVRGRRYAERMESPLKKKQSALKRISKREDYNRLRKLGKIKDVFFKKSH